MIEKFLVKNFYSISIETTAESSILDSKLPVVTKNWVLKIECSIPLTMTPQFEIRFCGVIVHSAVYGPRSSA